MTLKSTAATPKRLHRGTGASRLLIVSSPDPQKVGDAIVLSPKNPLNIGREGQDQHHLVLDDSEVSRSHASIEIAKDHGGFQIEDQQSHNGTFVNGQAITTCELEDGDIIRIGSHLLLMQDLTMEECRNLLVAPDKSESLIGSSIRIQMVLSQIRKAGPRDVPVLIQGEIGVGKELVAQSLHEQSGKEGKLIAVNCAALPEQLVESELFGHAQGSFTGASQARIGLFAEADGGTLFLDEIGEMPLATQAKLLRVLATGEVRGVGETKSRTVKTRVIAATNKNLDNAVDDGSFRGDLYSRLMGVTIHVPPLRNRREDILLLARYFLAPFVPQVEITPDAAEALLIADWRFNVRELKQIVHAIAPFAQANGILDLSHVPEQFKEPLEHRFSDEPTPDDLAALLRIRRDVAPNAEELQEVLRQFDGNVSRVAAFFGKRRRQIYRWAQKQGIEVDEFRSENDQD